MLLLFPCALITVKSNFIQTSTAYSCSTHIASHAELALQVLLSRILQSDCSEYKHLQCGNYPCSCSASFMVVHESGDFGLLFESESRPLIHVNADQENRPCDSAHPHKQVARVRLPGDREGRHPPRLPGHRVYGEVVQDLGMDRRFLTPANVDQENRPCDP